MEPPSATEARENDERIDMIKHVIASKSRVGKSHIFALKAAASVSVMSTSHNKRDGTGTKNQSTNRGCWRCGVSEGLRFNLYSKWDLFRWKCWDQEKGLTIYKSRIASLKSLMKLETKKQSCIYMYTTKWCCTWIFHPTLIQDMIMIWYGCFQK